MAVSLVLQSLLLYYQEHPLIFKHDESGMYSAHLALALALIFTSPPDSHFSALAKILPRIYAPAKTATQSGDWHSSKWVMDWDPLSKGHRWENPLMGWQSSADFMQGTQIGFKTKEDAIQFANKQGYEYFVQEPNQRRIVPKAYANNFMHSPGKLKVVRTK